MDKFVIINQMTPEWTKVITLVPFDKGKILVFHLLNQSYIYIHPERKFLACLLRLSYYIEIKISISAQYAVNILSSYSSCLLPDED